MKMDIGINLARPHPGACMYLSADVLNLRREWTYRLAEHQRHATSAALVMATSSSETVANNLLERLIDRVVPQMEFGRHAVEAFTDELTPYTATKTANAAVAWTNGHRLHLIFCGHMRVVLMCQGHARHLPPPDDLHPHWFEMAIEAGDWFIMAVPATDAALPLGSILKLTQQGLHATDVCRTAATLAMQADPLNHHAVLAMHRLPA
ncbi:MAG: hypothetical protein AAB263_19770 [Planctomycetota bacterium]